MKNIIFKILWILGWIFVFPIPTTLALCRVGELPKEVIYVLSVVAWIIYGLIPFFVFLDVDYINILRIICLAIAGIGSVVSVIIVSIKRAAKPKAT